MKVYPFKFSPIRRPMIWGGNDICAFKGVECDIENVGESWEISDVRGTVSIISNGDYKNRSLSDVIDETKADLLGKHVYERFGTQFPLLIKFIDAANDLSIQVHPDDELAKERHNSFGKTEMWYVISAREGAGLYPGFSQQIPADEYVARVENNSFMDTLKRYEVQSGDVFFLPAGRVHAIGSGLFIAEIQQTSDVTYRIYDYNRRDKDGNRRELHTDLAKDAIDYAVLDDYKTNYSVEENVPVELVECRYFHTDLLEITKTYQRNVTSLDSFVIYICMEGQGTLTDEEGNTISVNRGESILVPAAEKSVTITPNGKMKLLEVYIPE